jgi:hypothetical protein
MKFGREEFQETAAALGLRTAVSAHFRSSKLCRAVVIEEVCKSGHASPSGLPPQSLLPRLPERRQRMHPPRAKLQARQHR